MTLESAPPTRHVAASPDSAPVRPPDIRVRIVAIVVLAIGVRAHLCAQTTCISRDGVVFVELAQQLADDPLKSLRQVTKQPGLSILLLGGGMLTGADSPEQWQFLGQLISLLGGTAACIGVYFLTRRLFDERAAIVAGIFAVFWPHATLLSADVLSDMPHLALYLTAFLLASKALAKRSRWTLILCGVVAGLAYLLRQEALGIVAAASVCLAWFGPADSRMKNLTAAALLLTAFAVTIAPYSIATGRLLGNKGPEDLLAPLLATQFAATPDAISLAHVVSPWQAPGQMVELWAKSGRYVFAPLCLVALFWKTLPRARRKEARLVAAAIGMQLLLIQLRIIVYDGEISSRYLIIPAALSIPWAAAAFVSIVTHVAARIYDPKPSRRAAVWCSAFLIALTPLVYYITRGEHRQDNSLRAAGLWLRSELESDDTVLSSSRLRPVKFYAELTYPNAGRWHTCDAEASADDLVKAIRYRNSEWLVYLAGDEPGDRGATRLSRLLDRSPRTFGSGDRRVCIFNCKAR